MQFKLCSFNDERARQLSVGIYLAIWTFFMFAVTGDLSRVGDDNKVKDKYLQPVQFRAAGSFFMVIPFIFMVIFANGWLERIQAIRIVPLIVVIIAVFGAFLYWIGTLIEADNGGLATLVAGKFASTDEGALISFTYGTFVFAHAIVYSVDFLRSFLDSKRERLLVWTGALLFLSFFLFCGLASFDQDDLTDGFILVEASSFFIWVLCAALIAIQFLTVPENYVKTLDIVIASLLMFFGFLAFVGYLAHIDDKDFGNLGDFEDSLKFYYVLWGVNTFAWTIYVGYDLIGSYFGADDADKGNGAQGGSAPIGQNGQTAPASGPPPAAQPPPNQQFGAPPPPQQAGGPPPPQQAGGPPPPPAAVGGPPPPP